MAERPWGFKSPPRTPSDLRIFVFPGSAVWVRNALVAHACSQKEEHRWQRILSPMQQGAIVGGAAEPVAFLQGMQRMQGVLG